MNKQDKQLEKQLIKQLTNCCEDFKTQVEGFNWLTHLINFSNVNQSIKIICVFETNDNIDTATQTKQITMMRNDINKVLLALNIKIKKIEKHIVMDSEENCNNHHNGNWQNRFSRFQQH